ncbi:hypothetical protein LAT59_01675 [Candidatus Gracilibacteria bacterium]|nr:hypothetical protein [Candidatus Gracilibacteria bacterium]
MFIRILSYAIQNILRNTFLSLSSILILTLLMFFINILIVIHGVSFRIIDEINDRLTISLYLKDEYDQNSLEVLGLKNDLRQSIPSIEIIYKNKDDVLEEIRARDPELVNILELQNPLPETITLENIPLQEYQRLNTLIEKRMYILLEQTAGETEEYFSSYARQFERISTVIQVLNILQVGLYVIIVTFIISIAIIVYSIIGNFIYYYRDEIYITRLVGGSKFFLSGPFTVQALLYVGISFILSTILFVLLVTNISYVFELTELHEVYPGNIVIILFLQALIFLSVGGLSGFFSSQKYITKK